MNQNFRGKNLQGLIEIMRGKLLETRKSVWRAVLENSEKPVKERAKWNENTTITDSKPQNQGKCERMGSMKGLAYLEVGETPHSAPRSVDDRLPRSPTPHAWRQQRDADEQHTHPRNNIHATNERHVQLFFAINSSRFRFGKARAARTNLDQYATNEKRISFRLAGNQGVVEI